MTPQYIDVPAEACPRTLAASQSIRKWLRDELRRKLEPRAPVKRSSREVVGDSRLIAHIPETHRKQRATCKVPMPDGSLCGKKAQGREMCATHFTRKRLGRPMNPEIPIRTNRRADVTREVLLEMRAKGMSYRQIGRALDMCHSAVQLRLKPQGVGANLSDWSGSANVRMELESTYAADPRVTPEFPLAPVASLNLATTSSPVKEGR